MLLIPLRLFVDEPNYLFTLDILFVLIELLQIERLVTYTMKLGVGQLGITNVDLNIPKSCKARNFGFVTNRTGQLQNPFFLFIEIELSSSKVATKRAEMAPL
jgi:hypothetical protein